MLEDAFERSVGGHELGGRLLADARNAGEVVARVAAQRRVLRILRRRYSPTPLRDAGFVVERVIGDTALVVEHLDVRVGDQLERVSIAGHNDHIDAVGGGFGREGRDHVVGLDSRDLQLPDLQRFEHFMDEWQLRGEQIGRLFAPCLVVGIQLVAVGAPAGRVERDGNVIGDFVGDDLGQHRREAVDRVRDRARLRGQVGRESEERPVGERMAVEQQQFRHRPGWYAASMRLRAPSLDHATPGRNGPGLRSTPGW